MTSIMHPCCIRILSTLAAALVATLPAAAQRQVQKVMASNAVQGDEFGGATAIDGDWAIIGARYNNDRAAQAGSAYVFHRVNGVWGQTQELLASDGAWSDQFGCALAMSGDFLVVGALNDATIGVSRTGSAYVFERVGTVWIERAKLVASDAASGAQFGSSVAISGDHVSIGAWNATPVGAQSGRAYIFERFGQSWLQTANLVSNDEGVGDAFGISVSIDGDRLLVGSVFGRVSPTSRPGAAYVFERDAQGSWLQRQKLLASNGAHQDLFGGFTCISGSTLAVAGPRHNSGRGMVYAFEYDGLNWIERQQVTATDGKPQDNLFVAALSGDLMLAGANQDSDVGFYSGVGYLYRRMGGTWSQACKLLANDLVPNDQAFVLSFSGTTVLIGTVGRDEFCPQDPNCNSGAAYFFELAPTTIQFGSCLAGSPCNNSDGHGGCRNSTGQGAILQASGSGSCTTDDLVMEVRHLPPFAPGLIFMGGAQVIKLFGDGRRVVGDSGIGIYRIEIHLADADGVFLHGPGNVALTQGIPNPLGHIQAGQTWNYQCWYRDQQGPCGFGFNMTNGLQVSYVP